MALLALGLAACGASPVAGEAPPRPAPALPPAAAAALPPAAETAAAPAGPGLDELLGEPKGELLVVHFLSIGQGDAALIQAPGGKNVLVDSGPPDGRDELLRYLNDRGVHHLHLVINSHPHADHIGNLATLVDEMRIDRVLVSGYVHPTPVYERMLAALEKEKIPVKLARRGRTITLADGIALRILAPAEPLITGSRSDANANSVVFNLEYGRIRFLFTGDAEEETEERLLHGDRAALRATVLKVAHHGSRYATGKTFVRAVAPKLAVVSAGRKNRYGHPAEETLERLRAYGVKVLRTDRDGHVVVATDGRKLKIYTVPQRGGAFGGARVWRPGEPGSGPVTPRGPPAEKGLGININTAGPKELEKLPGVGKATAARIIEWRTTHGPFLRVENLTKVKGIGEKTLERLRPHVILWETSSN